MTQPGPLPPHHADAPHDPGDEMFLTPRIIDRRTFEEFSSLLRDLIRDAAGEGRTLRHAADEVKGVQQGLERATSELTGKLEAVVRMLPTLEQRIARMEQLLGATADSSRVQEEIAARVAATVRAVTDDAASQLRQQAAGIAETVLARLAQGSHQIDDALAGATAKLATARDDARREWAAALDDARQRLTADLPAIRDRLRAAAGDEAAGLEHAITRARDAQDALARRFEDLDSQLTAAAARGHERALASLSDARASLEQGMADAAHNAETLLANLDGRLGSVHAWATKVVEEVEDRLETWRQSANRVAGAVPAADLARLDELPGLIERAAQERRQLEESVRASADRIEGQSAALERLNALHDQLTQSIVQATDRCEETVRTLRDLSGIAGPPAESIAGAVAHLDRAAAALAQTAQAANASTASARDVIAQADAAAARLIDLLAKLEPWRSRLFAPAPERAGDRPEPPADSIDPGRATRGKGPGPRRPK